MDQQVERSRAVQLRARFTAQTTVLFTTINNNNNNATMYSVSFQAHVDDDDVKLLVSGSR